MNRTTRYQGAIIQDGRILLVHTHLRSTGERFWLLPGGGREDGESEEACVQRELLEETCLEVHVERLLLEEPGPPGGVYRRMKTYLCRPIGGEAHPGYEPVEGGVDDFENAAGDFQIVEVRWFDLRDESGWDPEMRADPITYPAVQSVRRVLGYL